MLYSVTIYYNTKELKNSGLQVYTVLLLTGDQCYKYKALTFTSTSLDGPCDHDDKMIWGSGNHMQLSKKIASSTILQYFKLCLPPTSSMSCSRINLLGNLQRP
jgi:hypothetical protein